MELDESNTFVTIMIIGILLFVIIFGLFMRDCNIENTQAWTKCVEKHDPAKCAYILKDW